MPKGHTQLGRIRGGPSSIFGLLDFVVPAQELADLIEERVVAAIPIERILVRCAQEELNKFPHYPEWGLRIGGPDWDFYFVTRYESVHAAVNVEARGPNGDYLVAVAQVTAVSGMMFRDADRMFFETTQRETLASAVEQARKYMDDLPSMLAQCIL